MSPFKGQGANQAIIDAFLLSKTIQAIHEEAMELNVSSTMDRKSMRKNARNYLEKFSTSMYDRTFAKVLKSRAAAVDLNYQQFSIHHHTPQQTSRLFH